MTRHFSCLCGALTIELHGEPVARANCHCSSCRGFYGVSMLSATAWNSGAIRVIEGQPDTFRHPFKQMSKTFCRTCGDVIFGTHRIGLQVVHNAMLARASDGALEAALAPTMHLFYAQRVVDISDTLVKYADGWDGPAL
jgi:hypothetical protein